ncbi:MAG: type I-C CRISPR-associated protein Cas8c/Csd1 [Desulfobulbaceae bacterium]|nr:type I-C CRISPR-associated protein Cas8c/Csd1 [Desulfobulbaceae bacterium]
MILQALNSYYRRLLKDPEVNIAPPGFSAQKVYFELIINGAGKLVGSPRNICERKGKRLIPRSLIVPEAKIRPGKQLLSNFMCDNTGYVLGADEKGKPERSLEQFEAFRDLHHHIGDSIDDHGMRALLAFLDGWRVESATELEHWEEMVGKNLVFRLEGEQSYIHDGAAVQSAWLKHMQADVKSENMMCLVSGEDGPVARLHPKIKGVLGAQTAGASLVSFNLDAFCSYNKDQSYNAPVNEGVAFGYGTALNYLLAGSSRQRIIIGDASTVFWTEKPSPVEFLPAFMFAGNIETKDDDKAEDSALKAQLHRFLHAARKGEELPDIDGDVKFYILGLAPNAARVAVRFWHVDTVSGFKQRVGEHFRDLAIERTYEKDSEYPPLWLLLKECAVQGDSKNIPPVLNGQLMRAVFTGALYPATLLNRVLGRINADQKINYIRAAIIKACLVRNFRKSQRTIMEVGMSLNTETTNGAYRQGRLFAVLERIQERALPEINANIRVRFYGAVSATPKTVFPQLMRLKNHHVAKLENRGEATNYEKLIGDIMDGLEVDKGGFSAHLNMEGQGLFALGYYHQRQSFFKKKENKGE